MNIESPWIAVIGLGMLAVGVVIGFAIGAAKNSWPDNLRNAPEGSLLALLKPETVALVKARTRPAIDADAVIRTALERDASNESTRQ